MREVKDAELARAWVECRGQVLGAITRSFPTAGSLAVEAAVDEAWTALYERDPEAVAAVPEGLPARWRRLAYLRALNGVRDRRRHPTSSVAVEELADNDTVADGLAGVEGLRAEARVREIMGQVSGDARLWLEAIMDSPQAPSREIARVLGWDREKLKSVSRRARGSLREFVRARESGVICERRRSMMGAFAVTRLVRLDPEHAVRFSGRPMLGSDRYEQVALHIAGCEGCEREWRRAQSKLLRPRFALFPFGLAGKLAAAGTSAIAAARRTINGLLADLRLRIGAGVGRAGAGGAAGTAGTASVLAGKGAAVCVGVLCAASAGTAALVGLPAAVLAPHAGVHRHHATIGAQRSQVRSSATGTAAALVSSTPAIEGQATRSSIPDAPVSAKRASAARAVGKPTRPATPGDLIASSATSSSKPESKSDASIATTASARSDAQATSTEPTYASSAVSKTTHTSGSSCVPGSLSC